MSDSTGTASGPGGLGDDPDGLDPDDLDPDSLADDPDYGDPTYGDPDDDEPGSGGLGSSRLDERDDAQPLDAVPAGALAGGAVAGARGSVATAERKKGRIRNIGTFYRQVIAELRKVIWPTRKELLTYTSVVVVFVVVMVAIVAAFDFAFGRAVLEVFGDDSL